MMTNLQLKKKLQEEEKAREEEQNENKLKMRLQEAVNKRLESLDPSPTKGKSTWLERLAQEKLERK